MGPGGYTTREVAEVLGLPTSRILAWTRSGLLTPSRTPNGAYHFSFQDISLLRTARRLLDANIPARRVRESLEALKDQLPVGRPLSAVNVSASGDRILVEDGDDVWEPDSGQLRIHLDVPVADAAPTDLSPPRLTLSSTSATGETSADDWYDRAIDLEGSDTDSAIRAYERALALDPGHADALLNLGRLHHEAGRIDEAEALYRAATGADPRNGRAFYNLGVALDDRGYATAATEAYAHSLQLEPGLAVAHFNLCRLLEADGRKAEALGHLVEYRRLMRTAEPIDS